jgi:prephenate dehydrogenase
VRTVSIIGLGLIGGSLGLALKRSGGWQVVGYARRPETAKLALDRGAVDFMAATPQAAAGADVVIVSTPVMATREVFSLIAGHLGPGSIVSDVASTKVQVMKWAQDLLPAQVSFIGGHPMAGKETPGLEVADADLFKNCAYCLVQTSSANAEAMAIMKEIVLSVGARPVPIEAETHDFLVAGISHLPLIVSTALVEATTQSSSWPQLAELASSGYRDASRLASTHPVMSRDICLSNQGPILEWLDRFTAELQKLRQLVGSGNDGLERAFEQANMARQQWLGKKEQKDKSC